MRGLTTRLQTCFQAEGQHARVPLCSQHVLLTFYLHVSMVFLPRFSQKAENGHYFSSEICVDISGRGRGLEKNETRVGGLSEEEGEAGSQAAAVTESVRFA